MSNTWEDDFRQRMRDFGAPQADRIPVSIKVRVIGGCFHREHSPEAYQQIDDCLATKGRSDAEYRIEPHENGPEILTYATLATAGLALTTAIINLVTAIIRARSDGIKKGDKPSEPLELIVRGYWQDGQYFEEKILRIAPDEKVTAKLISEALAKPGHLAPAKKKKRKKK